MQTTVDEYQHVKQGRIKRYGKGILKADLDRLVKEKKNPSPRYPVHEKIRKEQLKYRKWKAKREELIVKLIQGKLLDHSEVESAFVSRVLSLLSRRVSHKVVDATDNEYKFVLKTIDEEVRLFLEAFSSGSKYPQ